MIELGFLNHILDDLRSGKVNLTTSISSQFNDITMRLLQTDDSQCTQNDINKMRLIILISNILYNDTDRDILLLDDGVYDLILEKYKKFDPNYQVGAEPLLFNNESHKKLIEKEEKIINPIIEIDHKKMDESLFAKKIMDSRVSYDPRDFIVTPIRHVDSLTIEKRMVNTPHKFPKLVGTLDKCKFVMNYQAEDKGVLFDSNVKVFERDFIGNHIQRGILDPHRKFYMVAELKYDGVSVEAEVTDRVVSARSRGDTSEDLATDLTPILGGYRFRRAEGLGNIFGNTSDPLGMKFEAIITKDNLVKLSQIRGKEYKNCRNAIIGILGASDGYLYRDYITLVPLATSMDKEEADRLTEIEFMNQYYITGEKLRYVVLYGDYKEILFQVKKFAEEMEFIRPYINFLYDGVVISYIEPDLIDALGRENNVNKYSIAIKFNPLQKQSTFLGYTFTVGQNGTITPMIHYKPVEFYGGIHNKSTGNSYARFKELNLRVGDIINIEYVNDVMPRVSKPDIEFNRQNTNPVEQFTPVCPCCGSPIVVSDSGKSASCPNMNCPERSIARMANMMQKLGLKDFSEESLKTVAKNDLHSLLQLTVDNTEVQALGPLNAQKFIERINSLKNDPINDYKIMGSLGFTGIAQEKWKMILKEVRLSDIIGFTDEMLYDVLIKIKGIGRTMATTLIEERKLFIKDLKEIINMNNVISSYHVYDQQINIKVSGFRDAELEALLESKGCNVSDTQVKKDTTILLVPSYLYTSDKVKKAKNYGVKIVSLSDFKANMNSYI